MQTLDKVKDETRDRVPRPSAPKRIAGRAGKGVGKGAAMGAGKAGTGVLSRIASALSDLAKGLTGRKQAERRRKRKRNVTAAAAGAATASGAAGLYLAKKSRDGSKAAQPAPPEAYAPPVPNPNPNGQTADVTSGTSSTRT